MKSKNTAFLVLCVCALAVFYCARLYLHYLEDATLPFMYDSKNIISKRSVAKSQAGIEIPSDIYLKRISPKHILFLGRFIFGFDTYAYLHNSKTDQKLMVKKGSLLDQYKVQKVTKKYVILSKFGENFQINISDDKSSLGVNLDEAIVELSEYERIVNVDKVIASIDNINTILKDSFYFPQISDGKIVGIKLHKLSDHEIVSKSGFAEGDILKSVNGVNIKGFNDVLKLYKVAKTVENMQVSIERDGTEKVLNYKFKR